MHELQQDLRDLLVRYEGTEHLCDRLWTEVVDAYSAQGRHYHSLTHIEDLHRQLQPLRSRLEDPDAVLIAIVYHDIVMNVVRSDNELRNAELMRQRLGVEVGIPQRLVERAYRHIVATAKHDGSEDPDTDLFTDADLSILGAAPLAYDAYAAAVRREYGRFPDLLYKPGRRKVLKHFLSMPRIFKTDPFRDRYEAAARENLQWEWTALGGRSREQEGA